MFRRFQRQGVRGGTVAQAFFQGCVHTTPFISRYVFQEETGAEGTPHLQGVAYFDNPISMSTAKQWNVRLHLEPSRCIKSSVAYCSDADKRTGRLWARKFTVTADLDLLQMETLYLWQRELMEELRTRANNRTIIWYNDVDGGCGKTQLARLIYATFPGVQYLSSGNLKDATYQIVRRKDDPKIIVINLPRSAEGRFSYATLETIKDGIVYSGKYEGGTRIFPSPHIVVFANFFPDVTQLTEDRWRIRTLRNNPPRLAIA